MNIFSVLFDLDGTLLDTIPDLASACNAMRIDLGLPALAEERIATFVGKGSENLVRRALADLPNPSVNYTQALESFYYHYKLCNGQHSRLYPGVLEGLNDFQSQKPCSRGRRWPDFARPRRSLIRLCTMRRASG